MLLSIDRAKVEERLRAATPTYVVTPCNLEPLSVGEAQSPATGIVSTVVAMPPDLERARARLLALRERVIAAGHLPLSSAQLDAELDEARGRI